MKLSILGASGSIGTTACTNLKYLEKTRESIESSIPPLPSIM